MSAREAERLFRLSNQLLAMHHTLHEQYLRMSVVAEGFLVLASIIFLATTFASRDLFELFSLDPTASKIVLGLASVAAFGSSILLMLMDWRGKAALHRDAARRWSEVVKMFRTKRKEDGSWSEEDFEPLASAYWAAAENAAQIPDAKFNGLKAKYLRKIEISRTIEANAGVPWVFAWVYVATRGCWRLISGRGAVD